ncbi:histidine phosphatase family protein [Arthrobacter sp. A5]|uniref:histidine phosphatase family protein n=1 Tax=Arthrobacter sp. A5 TaxID=576926 RepID=UPI003DA7D28F
MGAVELMLIRHGESAGNVAATAAQAAGAEVIDIGLRDADVPLSETGLQQAQALGRWLSGATDPGATGPGATRSSRADPGTAGTSSPDSGSPSAGTAGFRRPDSVWCSPYLRARQTAEGAGLASGPGLRIDERLRDRELGILDLLTAAGVSARYPEEALRREWLGKFYYRPPGGESWADVALRLRSLLGDLDRLEGGGCAALVCHDAIVLLMRYVCEGFTEEALLALAAGTAVLNGSVTRLVRPTGSGAWEIASFNEVAHLEAAGAPVTVHAGDTNVQPR